MSQDSDDPLQGSKRRVVLITGMSGAGLSTALKALEDTGYESVDNLRLNLIPHLVDVPSRTGLRPLAVAIDTRNAEFSVDGFVALHDSLSSRDDLDVKLLYLECSNETLQHRFSTTRRRHPLAIDRPLMDGIVVERALVERLRDFADLVIDTTDFSIHDLRRLTIEHFRANKASGLTLAVMSFSYNYGVPREADFVFDARHLKNPHYVAHLRAKTGLDPDVASYIQTDSDYKDYLDDIMKILLPRLPWFQQEGKSYLTIAVGCTGGKHRSVALAQELATLLACHDYIVSTKHRELDRPSVGETRPVRKLSL